MDTRVLAKDPDLSGIGWGQPHQHANETALAGSVGTELAKGRSLSNREIDGIAGQLLTIAFGHAAQFDRCKGLGRSQHGLASVSTCRNASSNTDRTVSGVNRALTPRRIAAEN